MKRFKRFLYLLHRWIGVGFALLFVLWFASGIVMMYVEFPELTASERYAHLQDLDVAAVNLPPQAALERLPEAAFGVSDVRLAMVLGRPAYLVQGFNGRRHAVFADTGEPVSAVGPALAQEAASAFLGGAPARHLAEIDLDQWSLSGSLNGYRPLHKVAVDDGRGSILYVSERTGEVVRDTTHWERTWNWMGAVVHWIYPTILRKNGQLWSDVVIYLSVGGCIATVTGLLVGYWRLRLRRKYKSGSVSPFQGWMWWHHVGGLVCTVFVATFIFSGLMSMNPWGVFSNSGESMGRQMARFTGGGLDTDRFATDIRGAAALLPAGFTPREVQWRQHIDEAYLLFVDATGERIPVAMSEGRVPARIADMPERVAALVPGLLPDAQIVQSEVLTEFDNYYYSHHQRYRPLPVLRVRFDDAADTWYHIDLVSGEIRSRLTHTDRVQRWLYNGLHSLDFRVLMGNRPLWDIVVIILSIMGTAFSVTGVVIGWRRLKHKAKSARKRPAAQVARSSAV